jgi:hypothetical protein
MSDLILRSQEALAVDTSLPKWQRLHSMLQAFDGLELSLLDEDVRGEFESQLVSVNEVISRYDLESDDDYQKMSDADLDEALDAVTDAATGAIDDELWRIVADLEGEPGTLPVAAIEEARQHRDLITPYLVDAIREASVHVQTGQLESNVHFIALFLLSEFQSEEGFYEIMTAMSLPGDLPFDLFGDAVTEDLAKILAQFAGDRPELLDDLIANRNLNEYVRWEAAQTYIYLVRDGRMERDEAVDRLRKQLRQSLDRGESDMITHLVTELTRFGAREALEEIQKAFESQVVETYMIDFETAERELTDGDATFRKAIERCPPTGIQDTIAELQTWASYSEEKAPSTPASGPAINFLPDLASGGVPSLPEVVQDRVGRNAPCPCGSGKKFKKCCMRKG